MTYAKHFNPNETPQSEAADARQVANSAGGYSFAMDDWTRLDRFLILGAEGGSYYASEQKLTRENAKAVERCLTEDAGRAVERIAVISESGRAPKNEAAIFALALAASSHKADERQLALAALPRVCRIGTHLFHFVAYVDAWRGWGRQLRRAISNWYGERAPEALAREVAKYRQRDGWSHKDVLASCHASPPGAAHAGVYRWVVAREKENFAGPAVVAGSNKLAQFGAREYPAVDVPAYLTAWDELQTATELRAIALIREYGFTHEMLDANASLKNSAQVWEALLEKMPMTAMVRNLAKMTAVGLIAPMSAASKTVAERLADAELLKKARVHPIQMLSALTVYGKGKGAKGSLTWSPVASVVDALDAGFYASFGALEPSGARTVLALDVSGSMDWSEIAGVPGLTPRVASAAMAMVTARVEKDWAVMAFSDRLVPVSITPRQRIDDVLKAMDKIPMGGTDCSLPMRWAREAKVDADCFVVYTDSETWAGNVHPHQALVRYRKEQVPAAKLAVVGMVANEFSIADPKDAGMLDVVGFDTASPAVLADFARGGAA